MQDDEIRRIGCAAVAAPVNVLKLLRLVQLEDHVFVHRYPRIFRDQQVLRRHNALQLNGGGSQLLGHIGSRPWLSRRGGLRQEGGGKQEGATTRRKCKKGQDWTSPEGFHYFCSFDSGASTCVETFAPCAMS